MIQTLYVYLSLFYIFILLSYLGYRNKSFSYIICALIIYSTIFGLRYGVGQDFFGYKNAYELYDITKKTEYLYFEYGFSALIFICSYLGLNYSFFLGIVAFIQLFIIFKSFKNDYVIYPFLAFTFMFGCIWLGYANGLRQIMAFAVFCFSIQYVHINKMYKFYLCVLIAFLFHSSAILLVLIYPLMTMPRLKNKLFFDKISIQFLLVGLAIIVMNLNIVSVLAESLHDYMPFGYDGYLNADSRHLIKEFNPGLGFIVAQAINIILLSYSTRVNKFFKKSRFDIFYNLYFIGVLWFFVFSNSLIFSRINYYLYGFQYIVAAFTLVYLKKTKKYKVFYLLLSLYVLIFIAIMYRMEGNTALYIFNWQEDLFYLKNYIYR